MNYRALLVAVLAIVAVLGAGLACIQMREAETGKVLLILAGRELVGVAVMVGRALVDSGKPVTQ